MWKTIFLLISILFLSECTNNIQNKQVENNNIDYDSIRAEINDKYKDKIKDKIKISEINEKNGNESLCVQIPIILNLEDTNK